jgi:hypothetical protein
MNELSNEKTIERITEFCEAHGIKVTVVGGTVGGMNTPFDILYKKNWNTVFINKTNCARSEESFFKHFAELEREVIAI